MKELEQLAILFEDKDEEWGNIIEEQEDNLDNYDKEGKVLWDIISNRTQDAICCTLNEESKLLRSNLLYIQADPYHNYLYKKDEVQNDPNWIEGIPDIAVYDISDKDEFKLLYYIEVKTAVEWDAYQYQIAKYKKKYQYGNKLVKGYYDHSNKGYLKYMSIIYINPENSKGEFVLISTATGAIVGYYDLLHKVKAYDMNPFKKPK